jgi:hypothetical protein
VSIGFGSAVFFFGVSSTSSASKFRLSGSNQALIVDPLTESVAYETGFFPRLQGQFCKVVLCINFFAAVFNMDTVNRNGAYRDDENKKRTIKCMSENNEE